MPELKTKKDSTTLTTKVGLEIHVQLNTKSKMFCRCDNDAQGKAPNTVVCPVCLGLPGALPVANRQAIEWTVRTGLALNCQIPKIAKFDRKHYFYPDLPKGYQISQYDEPFCLGGFLEVEGQKIRLNRIHLEEDAGKLIHSGNLSLVDLNRAGTPLMEIVTEPDIVSAEMAGAFLRKLQKIVRDVCRVSEASMEKGHLRCDANISVNDGDRMSPIVEIKNVNSFRFVEKALSLVEKQLLDDCDKWQKKPTKETWGYNSDENKVYLQRRKEEAADYRYFPCPDLPPVEMQVFDLGKLKSELMETEEERILKLKEIGISEPDAKVIASDKIKGEILEAISPKFSADEKILAAKAIVHNYFGFILKDKDIGLASEYALALKALSSGSIQKPIFAEIAHRIHEDGKAALDLIGEYTASNGEDDLVETIKSVLLANPKEVERYKAGEKQLTGFFMGQIMKATGGKANPKQINEILRKELES